MSDGFHVTTAAYKQFVAANQLEAEISAALGTINPLQPATHEAAANTALGEPPVAVRVDGSVGIIELK